MTVRLGRPVRRAALVVGLVLTLVAALVGLAASPGARSHARGVDPLAGARLLPRHGAHLGAYYGDRSLAATAEALGRTPRIHLTYFGWKDRWATSSTVARDLAAGRLPLVNWEPFDVAFEDIVGGRCDAMLRARARQAKALRHEFFLDFAAEMNEEEGWGGHDPALYVAAYRHVHDVFARAGATNVVWVWAPNNTDSPGAPPALAYYPGDAYVDWTGMDGYNWGTSEPGFAWQSFAQVFAPLYDRLVELGKPIIVGETGSDEQGGSKARWISRMVPTLRHRFPAIRAVVWFDVRKERRWQIRSSRASSAAFRRLAADPYLR